MHAGHAGVVVVVDDDDDSERRGPLECLVTPGLSFSVCPAAHFEI